MTNWLDNDISNKGVSLQKYNTYNVQCVPLRVPYQSKNIQIPPFISIKVLSLPLPLLLLPEMGH